MVIDAHSIGKLKSDSEVQYLVIPVENKSGHKIQSRLPDESNLEEKIYAFLVSVGLENAFVRINVKKDSERSDSEHSEEFDLSDRLEEYKTENNKKGGHQI